LHRTMDLLLLCSFLIGLSLAEPMIDFAPPAPVRCRDDPDLKDCCKKLKGKGFCNSQVEFMEIICAETCNYCPKEKFSKDIDEIIKEQKKLEKATGGNVDSIKEGLKDGKGLPTAEGKFEGKGKTEAEKEATEVPGKEGKGGENGENDEDNKNGKDDKDEQDNKTGKDKNDKDSENQTEDEKEKADGKEEESDGKVVGEVGATTGCDKKCQTECVKAHNKYRENHGAKPLKWDRTLAEQAQAVADKNAASNKFEHSDWAAGKGGECIAWGPIKPSWLIAVKDWHDEEKNYDWKTGKSSNGKAIGHFTQVVWKKATKVGCGKSEMTMYGSKGPFYIAQMDVVGIVQNKKELDLVGKPKESDLKWFEDLRDKQMKSKNGSKKRQNFEIAT